MNEHHQQPNESGDRAHRPRKRRRYPWILLGVLGVLLAMVAAAPSLLSSSPLRNTALNWYNQSIPGSISVEELSLSWLGGQSARALAINDSQGAGILRLDELTTDLSLLDALRRRLSLGRTVLTGLDIDLRIAEDGTDNLTAALGGGEPATGAASGGPVIPLTGNMTLVDGRIALTAPGIDPVALENLAGDISMADPDAPILIRFSGNSRQGKLQGSINLDGQISGLFSGGRLTPETATASVDAGIEDLPVDALDRLLGYRGMLSAALGDRTSVHINANGDAAHQDVSIDATSPNAQLMLEGAIADGRFRLRNPAAARLTVTPGLVDVISGPGPGAPPARLAAPVPLQLEFESLGIPLEDFSVAGVALKASLSAGDVVRLSDIENVGDLNINELQLQIDSPGLGDRVRVSLAGKPVSRDGAGDLTVDADIHHLIDDAGNFRLEGSTVEAKSSIAGLPTSLVDSAFQQNGLLVDALGDTFGLELNADTDPEGRFKISGSVDADRLQTGTVELHVDDGIVLARPAQLHIVVNPQLWRRLLGEEAGYQLAGSTEWTVDIATLRIPVPAGGSESFQPGAVLLEASASSPSLSLVEPGTSGATRLENPNVAIAAGSGLGEFEFTAGADVMQPDGMLESLDASPLRVGIKGNTGLNEDASLKSITSVLDASGKGMDISLSTVVEENLSRLTLTEPSPFTFTLTPALVAAWQDDTAPAVALERNAGIRGTLASLTILLSPFELTGLEVSGNAGPAGAGPEAVGLVSPGGAVTRLDDTRVAFAFTGGDGGRGQLEFTAGVRSDSGESGNAALEASATNLVNTDGELSGTAMNLDLSGTLEQLPVALLDQVLAMEGTASATLGPTADIELSARLEAMQGPVSLNLTATNASADIKARLGDRGLTLSEPLVAQVAPTPEFGSQVLAKVHPIFETTQRAERPIRFEMPAEGVLIPVENYDFSRITVPVMTLDFGKIILKSGWLLRGIVDLGQRFGKLGSVEREEFEAWFTPGVMEIRDGRVLYTRRLDVLLAEKLHLATWGSADVSGDRSDLVLAFMPGTMERVFSITVAGDDALHVPITGPLSSPGIDFRKAGADLARLRAREEVSGENPLAGALLGAITGRAGSGGGAIPPASVTPLPWAEQLEALDAAEARRESGGAQDPAQPRQEADQPAQKKPSTEEQVIRGIIDIFGRKKDE